MAYTSRPGGAGRAISPWYQFSKQFLKPYGVQDSAVGINNYWRKVDHTCSELHARPKIGLSEAAESIGENAELIKQTLQTMDTEELITELNGLQQLFFPLNSRNKTPVDKTSYPRDLG